MKGRVSFVSFGRSEVDGFYLIDGKLRQGTGGRQVFFPDSKRTLGQGWDVFVIYSDDGRKLKEVSVSPLKIELTQFDISVDNNTIAFIAKDDGIENLYTIDTNGGNLVKLTGYAQNYWNLGGAKFSPDGKTILFHRTVDRDPKFLHVYVYDLNTGVTSDLTEGLRDNAFEADWSPDGSKIAFVSIDDDRFRNLYLLDLATREVTQLTHFNKDYYGQVYHPSYSPWGDQIAFALAARDKNAGSEIFAINTDGTNLIRLTPAKKLKRYPYWASDDYPDWGK
ncbi:MAG: hypothetical protein GX625_05065 [Clostridiaceae bacterium]|nr:hypothetical protein [Clostridiaceae bacterium]